MLKTIENILKEGKIEEYKTEAKLIIESISGLTLDKILIANEIPNKEKMLEIAQKRAQTQAPIQHILGFAYFMGEKYIVNENVLIPRDETEFLVNCGYELIKNQKNKIDILDIGVGSGCVSCALAKKLINKEIEILGVDISLEAISVALENINKLDLIRKVILRKSDVFSKIRDIEKFDLIISNPPYIPISQKNELDNVVKNFDPHLALFAPDEDGIEFYKKIIETAPKFLKKGGFLAFELGVNQSEKVKKLLEADFKNIQITKDLANIDRIITAQLRDKN